MSAVEAAVAELVARRDEAAVEFAAFKATLPTVGDEPAYVLNDTTYPQFEARVHERERVERALEALRALSR